MANGQAKAFGPKEETLRKVLQDVQPMAGRLKVVAEGTQGTAP
jgi:UDP-N-acetylmuramyl tripeptide synthase